MNSILKMTFLSAATIGIALAVSGCAKTEGADHDHDHDHEAEQVQDHSGNWVFDEGRGVRLTEAGRNVAGIELAEAVFAEGGNGTITATGQVFAVDRSSGTARASVALSARRANGIEPIAPVNAGTRPGDLHLAGHVERVDRQAVRVTGQVEVIVSVPAAEARLREGSFLSFSFDQPGAQGDEMLRIPASALLPTARGDFVYVVNGNHFFRSPVQTGRKSGDFIEIEDGLFEGDVVVSAGKKHLWLIELQAINGGEACADGH